MSRSGYSDDYDNVELYRAAVDRATFGKRGQSFMWKLGDALDAMPVKALITGEIANSAGEVCALGAVDPITTIDPEDPTEVGKHFNIARSLAAEIVYENDEGNYSRPETPEERWIRMRAWVAKQIGPKDQDVSLNAG